MEVRCLSWVQSALQNKGKLKKFKVKEKKMVKTVLNPGPTEVRDGPDITVSANALCWSKPCSSEHWKKYQTWLGNEHLRQF